MKNKHLSLEDRFQIENGLNNRLSFKKIASLVNKDCTTISREVRNHYLTKNTGGIGRQLIIVFQEKLVLIEAKIVI